MGNHVLEAKNLVAGYDGKAIIKGLNLTIPEGKISVIIGSNGCGKSTLLKTFCRLNKVMSGDIYLDNKPVSEYSSKEISKIISLMPQSPLVPEGITVYDLISRGRFPYRKVFRGLDDKDFKAIEEAMQTMGVTELRDRAVDELSGGQRQRVWIALALAQQTDILFLDEPTTFLDIAYQVEILDLLGELNRTKKTTVIMVLHDINLSVRYADYIFALKSGNLYAEGRPENVISEKLIKDVYGLDSKVITDPTSDAPMVIPMGKHHKEFEAGL
ncbi:ABC transporter ATP-binding protein [Stomatobaculum longum]|uniref:ABC transporter ATP-binding protein n=1 Tax=Stomatobaculum longum TaxID=796942 RepID=UPI0028ED16EE|nr:ABC transporter ATP-binding protein [Stomatobaculum longum]